MHQLKTSISVAIISFCILSISSCKKESDPLVDSYNIIDVDENTANHYHLFITAASRSFLQRSDPVTFTLDTTKIRLRILGFLSGTGTVRVLDSANVLFSWVTNRDTTIADTLWSRRPRRIEISFDRFSGGFELEMN